MRNRVFIEILLVIYFKYIKFFLLSRVYGRSGCTGNPRISTTRMNIAIYIQYKKHEREENTVILSKLTSHFPAK